MRVRHLGVFVAAILSAAMVSSSASADDGKSDGQDNPTADSQETKTSSYYQLPTRHGKTREELVRELSRPLTDADVAKLIAQTERNSSTADYYPDAPDDSRTDPPPLDDDGEEVVDESR